MKKYSAAPMFFCVSLGLAAQTCLAMAPEALLDPRSSAADKTAALDTMQGEGVFSERAGTVLLAFLGEGSHVGLRPRAAKVFYLLFYDLRPARAEALKFLLDPAVKGRFRTLLVTDPEVDVQRYFAQTGQIMLNAYKEEEARELALAYAPILIEALGDPDEVNRNEVIVALESFKGTGVLAVPAIRKALKERAETEQDEFLREMLMELAKG